MARPTNRRPAPRRMVVVWVVVLAVIALGAISAYLFTRHDAVSSMATTDVPRDDAEPGMITSRHIYSETADPKAEIAAALQKAASEHKRVIVDFGGDWCGDCQILEIYMHLFPNAELLEKNFVLVHVWVGHVDQHLDIAREYGIPLEKGVPALAVLAPDGKALYAQRSGEFEKMRQMNPNAVTDFLKTWKS